MLKSKKGFTLVELMIVIAIISLLMIVLVPALGLTKNKVREAGVRSNKAMLTGIIHSIIDDYPATDAGIDALESRIKADIESVTVDNQMLKNPITKGTDVVTATADLATKKAVSGYVTLAVKSEANIDAEWTDGLANAQGIVAYGAFVNGNKINVRLIPYGPNGKRLEALVENISQ